MSLVRIGVDVGGTFTDAVILDTSKHAQEDRGVLAFFKTPTTSDPTDGIETALKAVLAESKLDKARISSVTIGTTAFLNAVIERDRRRLSRVAVIRLSKSFLRDVRPLCDWPQDLAAIVQSYVGYADGGLHIDGSQEAEVIESQVIEQCQQLRKHNATAVVVAGVYSPIDRDFHQEEAVRAIIARELPEIDVVCSHEVANIGFLERENASILNASILRYARRTIRSFQQAIVKLELSHCPLYLTQNDGTVLDAVSAARVPIRTFSSGATNSMRGAAYLSGATSGQDKGEASIVVDIGGTTTDVGMMLPSGMPRQASAYVSVTGVNVNYSLPDLHSVGLGGGSIVSQNSDGTATVGPASVGSKLDEFLIFGGKTITATDIAVAAGMRNVGQKAKVQHLNSSLIKAAQERMQHLLEQAIDTIKTSPEDVPVFLTGGGSLLAPEIIKGASVVIKPPFHTVANAVGAACSKVGATIDIIQNTSQHTAAEASEKAKSLAIEATIQAGAVAQSVYIAKLDVMPIPYLENQVRSVVTAIGDLDETRSQIQQNSEDLLENTAFSLQEIEPSQDLKPLNQQGAVDHAKYIPSVAANPVSKVREWTLSKTDLDYIADGCYLLGCGGGGNPNAGRLQLRDMIDAGYSIRVVDVSSLKDDALVYWGGRMGAPAAISERLQAHETVLAIRALMDFLGHQSFDAAMGLEIGGSNGMEPFLWGSSRFFDRPVIDGDFMGRANPMCWQTTLTVHLPGEFVPCAIDSGSGSTMLMTKAARDEAVDKPLRGAISEMGSLVGLAPKPTKVLYAKRHGVLNTVSLAWRIGRAIARAEASNTTSRVAELIIDEVGGSQSAKVLFQGKICNIERTLHKGLSVGVLHIMESQSYDLKLATVAQGGILRIPFINENILAEHTPSGGVPRILATVPDLIALIDRDTGRAVGVPEYRYGCHVVVLGIACSPRWTETPRGLEVGGPKSYGYDLEYKPLGVYSEPRSVVEEYCKQE